MTDGSVASWVQTGGVLAFASLVLLQLREIKPVLTKVTEVLSEVGKTVAQLLERERARAERIAAAEAARRELGPVRADYGAPAPEPVDWEETPPLGTIAPRVTRARTNPGRPETQWGPMKPGRDKP